MDTKNEIIDRAIAALEDATKFTKMGFAFDDGDVANEADLWRCTVCGRIGTVGRCCGEETREPVRAPNGRTNPALPETTEGEAWYDAEIAPALAALAKRCHERGMAFVAAVEYQPGDRAGTYYLTEKAGLAMEMLNLCAQTAPNVDSYIMHLRKLCKEQGIDTGGSFALRALGA